MATHPKFLKKGALVKIADGLIVCRVLDTFPEESKIKVLVTNSGKIGQRKNVNLAGTMVDLPAVTEKDKSDLKFAVEQGFDCIAASFTRDAKCSTRNERAPRRERKTHQNYLQN